MEEKVRLLAVECGISFIVISDLPDLKGKVEVAFAYGLGIHISVSANGNSRTDNE